MSSFCTHTSWRSARGVGLIEVVIGIGIFVIIITSIIGAYRFLLRFSGTTSQTVKAYYLLEEGIEVARVLRDTDWGTFSGLTSGTPYYLTLAGNTWSTVATPVIVDGVFYRTITLSDVYRDGTNDIASSGTLDPNTYLVTVAVSWARGGATTTKALSGYLMNIFQEDEE